MPGKATNNANGEEYISGPELALRTGERYSTIDHWSSKGLLIFKYRGRNRQYEPVENVKRCKRIRALQEKGMNLVAIESMFRDER